MARFQHMKNLKGRKFNYLKVVGLNAKVSEKKGRPNWDCVCDCGKKVVVSHGMLIYDAKFSCGCVRRPIGKKRFHTVHHEEGK